MDMTPLEKIQHETADALGLARLPHLRQALDAALVRAFDAGSRAQRDLDAELSVVLDELASACDPNGYARFKEQ